MGYTGPLSDKDRIFTNVYGFQSPDLKAAQAAATGIIARR
jgi:NADH-quinone oxidoreductase subunit F